MAPWLYGSWPHMLTGTVLFLPVGIGLAIGQNAALVLLLFAVVWRGLHDNNDALAGVAAGLLMFKPQYGVPLVALLAATTAETLQSLTQYTHRDLTERAAA